MARIRTIKPEFWTDETVTECSVSGRLLFIGMWNFADDNGNIERSSKQMKMKIFPADNINVEVIVQELIKVGLLIEYSVGGCKYLHIKGFLKHQVINKPSKFGHPRYDNSLAAPVVVAECSGSSGGGNGREVGSRKGMEGKILRTAFAVPAYIPVDLWNAFLQSRKQKRAANTDYALGLVIKKLEKLGDTEAGRIELLNYAIEKGWTTVFEPQDFNSGKKFDPSADWERMKKKEVDPVFMEKLEAAKKKYGCRESGNEE